MRHYRPLRHALVAAILLALLTALAFLPARADALVRMTPAVALWRILVHEAGVPRWDEASEAWVARRTGRPWGDDAYLLTEVILRGVERGQGGSYIGFAQTYAHRMFLPLTPVEQTRARLGIPLDGNRWAGFLETDMGQPDGWSGEGSWSRYQAGVEYAYALAQDVVQYDLLALGEFSPCEAPVDDWGSPRLDSARAVRIGLVPVDCGPNVVNAGYARPSQIRARAQRGETYADPD